MSALSTTAGRSGKGGRRLDPLDGIQKLDCFGGRRIGYPVARVPPYQLFGAGLLPDEIAGGVDHDETGDLLGV